MNVVYTHRAQNDLHDIYEYIAFTLLSPENAASTVRRIIETVRSLEQLPERNPLYGDEPWSSRGLRFAATRNYLIFIWWIQLHKPYPLQESCTEAEISKISSIKSTTDTTHYMDGTALFLHLSGIN